MTPITWEQYQAMALALAAFQGLDDEAKAVFFKIVLK